MIAGYELQFFCIFETVRIGTVFQAYRMAFYRKGHPAGTATEINAGEDPWQEETPEMLIGVKAKKIRLQVMGKTGLDLAAFYTDSDRDVFVELQLEVNPTTYLTQTRAWLNPFEAKEPYAPPGYPIELSAACGLGSLDDYPLYQYPTTAAYSGPQTLHELLKACLRWTGYELPLRTWTGRYEVGALQNGLIPGGTFDPLRAASVHPRRWLKSDGTYESCKKVLDDLCTAFGAVLVQHAGRWYFLSVDATTNPQTFHHYDNFSGGLQPVNVTENLFYEASPTGDVYFVDDPEVGLLAPRKQLKIKYEYGEPVSLLVNGDFAGGSVGWTVGANVTFEGTGEEDSLFRARIDGSRITNDSAFYLDLTAANLRQSIIVTRATRTVISSSRNGQTFTRVDAHLIELAGLFVNVATQGAIVILEVKMTNGAVWYLSKTGGWTKKIEELVMTFQNTWQVNGNTSAKPTTGERISVTSEPVPGSGNYTITLMLWVGQAIIPTPTGFPSITYRDMRVSIIDNTNIPIKGEQWTVTAGTPSATERKRSEELSLVMGDQIALSSGSVQSARYGALLKLGGSPTSKWLLNGRVDFFQKLTAWSFLRWLSPKTRTLEGDTILNTVNRPAPPPFARLGMADLTPPMAGFPVRWVWDVKYSRVTVRLHAVPPSLITETYRGSYETPDGVLVPIIEPANAGDPAPIPGNPTPRQNTNTTGSTTGLPSGVTRLLNKLSLTARPITP